MRIIPLHCVNICPCDWFKKKKANWPVARQDLGGRENAGKKDRVRTHQPDMEAVHVQNKVISHEAESK